MLAGVLVVGNCGTSLSVGKGVIVGVMGVSDGVGSAVGVAPKTTTGVVGVALFRVFAHVWLASPKTVATKISRMPSVKGDIFTITKPNHKKTNSLFYTIFVVFD